MMNTNYNTNQVARVSLSHQLPRMATTAETISIVQLQTVGPQTHLYANQMRIY